MMWAGIKGKKNNNTPFYMFFNAWEFYGNLGCSFNDGYINGKIESTSSSLPIDLSQRLPIFTVFEHLQCHRK